jgi:hypothetical protein
VGINGQARPPRKRPSTWSPNDSGPTFPTTNPECRWPTP